MLLIIVWCFLVLLLIAATSLLWYQRYSKFFRLLNEIPGPKGHPILGITLLYASHLEDFFEFGHGLMKEYFPIFKEWWFWTGGVNLQHPDDLEVILASTEHTEKSFMYKFVHPWLGTGLLTSCGAKWQSRRKLLTPAFHFASLQSFVDVFNKETAKLVDQLTTMCHLPFVDLIPITTELALKTICETSMGIEIDTSKKDWKDYKQAIHNFSRLTYYRLLSPWLHPQAIFNMTPTGFGVKSAVKVLHEFTRKVIAERRKNRTRKEGASYPVRKRLALLDLLLSSQDEGFNIDDEGIREEVDTFMFEGHDTISVAICHTFLLLANNRKIQDEVCNEILEVLGDRTPEFSDFSHLVYMERCLKECLRLYPSVPYISRTSKSDVKLATGYTVPAGALISLHIWDVHRNPEIYPDPERFDPDRFLPEATKNRHPFAYIPFSAGPRNCIGQRYAMLELKAVLCGVLRKFILEPVDTQGSLSFKPDFVLRTKSNSIKVKFSVRSEDT